MEEEESEDDLRNWRRRNQRRRSWSRRRNQRQRKWRRRRNQWRSNREKLEEEEDATTN